MIDFNKYTKLYENAVKMDVKDVYNPEEINEILQSGVFNKKISDEFTEYLKSLVSGDDINKKDMMDVLYCALREYLLKGGLNNKNIFLSIYCSILYYGHSVTYTSNEDSWQKAICMGIFIIKNPALFNSYGIVEAANLIHLKNSYPNQVAMIEAYKYFRKLGVNLNFRNGKIEISSENENKIFSTIDYNLSKIGFWGQHILIDGIQKFKNPVSGLYKFTNNSNDMITPLPFLLKISLKYASKNSKLKPKELDAYFNRALVIATNYIALYDLQTHSYDFRTIHADASNILEILQKSIISDQVFKIDQYYMKDVVEFVNFLIFKFYEEGYSYEDINNIKNIMNAFASVKSENRISFYQSGLNRFTPELNGTLLRDSLNSISFNSGSNVEFNNINLLDKMDYNFKPLYKINNDYYFLDKNIFSIGFYEIYASLMRTHLPSINNKPSLFDSNTGVFVENYIADHLSNKGIKFKHGEKYKFKANVKSPKDENDLIIKEYEGECDFIIETDERIIFFECKKKPLTRKAKSGDIYHFLSDVAYSLYDSQIQNNKHELILKRYGSIPFLSGFVLNLDSREVIKISVTSLDFLSLHDKVLSQRLMLSLYGRALVAHPDASKDQKSRLNKFNKIATTFSELINNEELRYQVEHVNGFNNTLFINMFHLFYVLRLSHDTNTFVSSLLSTKQIITAAKDFYIEHSNLIKMRS